MSPRPPAQYSTGTHLGWARGLRSYGWAGADAGAEPQRTLVVHRPWMIRGVYARASPPSASLTAVMLHHGEHVYRAPHHECNNSARGGEGVPPAAPIGDGGRACDTSEWMVARVLSCSTTRICAAAQVALGPLCSCVHTSVRRTPPSAPSPAHLPLLTAAAPPAQTRARPPAPR